MPKLNYGDISNTDRTEVEDIDVTLKPSSIKDLLIGGALVITGIGYLVVKAFKHGSDEYYKSELKAQSRLGIVDLVEEDIDNFQGGKWK